VFYVYSGLDESLNKNKDSNAQFIPKWSDAQSIDRNSSEAEKCPSCGRSVTKTKWLPPRKITLSNKRFPDRIGVWIMEPLVVSERVKQAYEREGLTGIHSFEPIEVVKVGRKIGAPSPQYYYAEISLSEKVRIDGEKSQIKKKWYDWTCDLCYPFNEEGNKCKILLKEDGNEEKDVFKLYSFGLTVFSEKFYQFVEKYNFTNFNLIPIDQYQLP